MYKKSDSKITVWKKKTKTKKQIEINTYVFYKQWHKIHVRVVTLLFHLPYDSQRSVLNINSFRHLYSSICPLTCNVSKHRD